MRLEDVMALVHAGYTKDEIGAMTAPEPAPAPAPAPAPEPAPTPAPEPAPTPAPAPAPTPAPTPAPAPAPAPAAAPATPVSQTEALLREILGAVQMSNIKKITTEPPVEKGADVVTARIINPNYGKEK